MNAVVGGEAEGAVADDAPVRCPNGGAKGRRALAVVKWGRGKFDEGVKALGKRVPPGLGQREAVQIDHHVFALYRDRGEEAQLVGRERVEKGRPIVRWGIEHDVLLKHVPPRGSNAVGSRSKVGLPHGNDRKGFKRFLNGPDGVLCLF